MKHFLVTASVVALMATGAHASVVDLTNGAGGDVTSLGSLGSFDNGSISGTIVPSRNFGSATAFLTQNSDGLGVTGAHDTDDDLDSLFYESIKFDFAWNVNLISVSFGAFNTSRRDYDDYEISVDGSPLVSHENDNPFFFLTDGLNVGSFTVTAKKTKFFDVYDDFRVMSFEVAPVPVPAAGFLLLGALGGLAGLRRRKKAS